MLTMSNNSSSGSSSFDSLSLDAEDTPLALLVSSAAYVVLGLVVLVRLTTQPNPKLATSKKSVAAGGDRSNTHKKGPTGTAPDKRALDRSGDNVNGHDDTLLPQEEKDDPKRIEKDGDPADFLHTGTEKTASPATPPQQQQQPPEQVLQETEQTAPSASAGSSVARSKETAPVSSFRSSSFPKTPSSPSSPNRFFSLLTEAVAAADPKNNTKRPPSVASTSRLMRSQPNSKNANTTTIDITLTSSSLDNESRNAQQQQEFPRPLRSWDLMSSATMRFRHGHFSGHSVQRLVQQERALQEFTSEHGSNSHGSWRTPQQQQHSRAGQAHSRGGEESSSSRMREMHNLSGGGAAMSSAADHVLEAQNVEGEAEFYRQRYIQRAAAQQQQNAITAQQQPQDSSLPHAMAQASFARRWPFWGSSSGASSGAPSVISRTSSGRSRMPRLSPDVVAPQDAADAFDPGTSLPGDTFYLDNEYSNSRNYHYVSRLYHNNSLWTQLLDLAEPDYHVRRIWSLALPATLGALADPCFRLGLATVISQFLDVDSMVAYVLVVLFVRITIEELSGAITDAESALLNQALNLGGQGGFDLAGQQIQLAILLQIATALPLFIAWSYCMGPLVSWLVPENDRIADLAASYTAIIVVDYGLQSVCRTFMLVFHMTGQAAQLELHMDLLAFALTIAALALMASLMQNPSLKWIGWIQVIVGATKVLVKVGIVLYRGWLQPYRKGLFGTCSLSHGPSVWAFVATSLPLLLGSLIELREWELLLLFVRHLGGDKVATWALMGIMWEFLEASTEGLGEAAAVQVSLLLSENQADTAQLLARKSVFLGFIGTFVITGIFFLVGPSLSMALTKDATLQNLFNDLVGSTGLASVSMSLSQVYWSLLGSQGRFGIASSTILLCRWLLTMPLAAVYIFAATFDLRAVASALAVGYMTASVVLAWRLFQSDWGLYAQLAQEEQAGDGEGMGLLEDDDGEHDGDEVEVDDDDDEYEESSDDSSTGFG